MLPVREFVIAVDIGNTRTQVGLIDCVNLTCKKQKVFSSDKIRNKVGVALNSFSRQGETGRPTPVYVSTVINSLRKELLPLLKKTGIGALVEYNPSLPIKIAYDPPQVLGSDRIANLLYARAAYPGHDSIVIDTGTAITVDYLRNGSEFVGGVILPGVETQCTVLHTSTAELPKIDTKNAHIPFPGTSTRSCIAHGVREGVAGALSRLVHKLKNTFSKECIVLTTGGGWSHTAPLIDFETTFVPDLTLIGTGLFQEVVPSKLGTIPNE
ncbi:MAG: type III pantothenate kinase [Chitinivibrionales bacterium]|nr:type III pantothenate kinase [Chitinivibrionales bacterium]